MPNSSRTRAASSREALEQAFRSADTRCALMRMATRRLGNRADAEDCLQEAFLSAFLRVGQLREPERVRSWLTSILVNTSRMRLRASRVARRGGGDVVVHETTDVRDPSCGADEQLHALRLLVCIRARASRYDERDLRVVDALMHDDAGCDDRARRCDMTTSAFKARVSRLRKRLRKAGLADAA